MRPSNKLFNSLTAAAWLVIAILALIILFIFYKSLPFFDAIGPGALWRDDGWVPTQGSFNLVPMLAGSLIVTAGAVALSAPIGVMLAIWGRYYAPAWLGAIYRALIELLAGVPSVVYGLWGLIVLVPWLAQLVPPGASVLAGVMIVALMILPLVVLVADIAFSQTPKQWLDASDALAVKPWTKIWRLILPNALGSILSGVMLQTGRALGETMAVLMVCGNIVKIPTSIFSPVRTLTANIALEMSYAVDMHVNALFVSGLVLLALTIALVLGSRRLKEHYHR